jgi:hypothetical protein
VQKQNKNAADAIASTAGAVHPVAGRQAEEVPLADERRGRRRDPGDDVAKRRKTILGGAGTETSTIDRQHVEGPAFHR